MPFVSQAQRGLFYHKEQTGEFSPEMVKHWEDATPKGKKLPKHVKHHKKHAFVAGFHKTAVVDLADDARYLAIVPMQDYSKGSNLNKETGQRRQVNARTQNVRNEDREFTPAIRHNARTSRAL